MMFNFFRSLGDGVLTSPLEHLVYALVLARYRINILDVALPKASAEPKHSIRQKCKVFCEKRLKQRSFQLRPKINPA